MSVRRWYVAGAALVLATVLAAPTAAFAVAGWTVRQLAAVTGPASAGIPVVSGDRVVWARSGDATCAVWTFRAGVDATPVALTTTEFWNGEPVLSGERVAWIREVGDDDVVFTRLMSQASAVKVSDDATSCNWLAVSGDRLAWEQGGGVYSVKMGSSPGRVDTSDQLKSFIVVAGDRIAWIENGGSGLELWTWKMGGSASLVATSVARNWAPAVSGDRIVWMQTVPPNRNMSVLTQLMGTDATPTVLSAPNLNCDQTWLSGSRAAWQAEHDGLDLWQPYTRLLGHDTTAALVWNTPEDVHDVDVSGNTVVWTDYVAPTWLPRALYVFKIGTDTTPTLVATGNIHFTVSGDRVAWQDRSSGDRVFYAKRITTPKLTRTPSSSSVTLRRSHGKAYKTLSVKVNDADGTLVAGATVKLQYSANGRTRWTTVVTLKSNASGVCSRKVTWKTRGTRYYRWYAPSRTGYRSALSSKYKVTVR